GIVRVIEPLFPCYVFVRCVLEERVDQIRYVTGISTLVSFGQRIATVPEAAIDELKQCFGSEEAMTMGDGLEAGAEVTVANGPFMGFSGIVVRALPAVRRVQILL